MMWYVYIQVIIAFSIAAFGVFFGGLLIFPCFAVAAMCMCFAFNIFRDIIDLDGLTAKLDESLRVNKITP